MKDTFTTLYTKMYTWRYRNVAVSIVFFLLSLSIFIFTPPFSFEKGTVVTIPKGETITGASKELQEQKVIRSSFLFTLLTKFTYGDNSLQAGDYLFLKGDSLFTVITRLAKAQYGFSPKKITIPEGLNIYETATLLEKEMLHFDTEKFITLASTSEGYLFPETYFFLPYDSEEHVVEVMQNTFDQKIQEFLPQIEEFGMTLQDVIIMASIVEEEARQTETRKIVAGILWKRLEIGMALQVDATFKYINGKTSFDLTLDDLQEDSPYNTYTRRGLPPTAIANPSIDSIVATIEPIETSYLYFLTSDDGVMHYAETFEEHVENKRKYLK